MEAVTEWVRAGGALFLIADHMPFPGAAENLAAAFGFTFYNGFAIRKGAGKDIFTPANGLSDCALTQGRNDQERVSSVQTLRARLFHTSGSESCYYAIVALRAEDARRGLEIQ